MGLGPFVDVISGSRSWLLEGGGRFSRACKSPARPPQRFDQNINALLAFFLSIFNIIGKVSFLGVKARDATLQVARISVPALRYPYSF
jgi:hypothetical protein